MANTLDILERTLAQAGDSTNSLYTLGTTNGRESVYEPLVVRITDHADNDAGETGTDTEKMALFLQMRHGEPLLKEANVLQKVIHSNGQGFTGTFIAGAGIITGVTITDGGSGYSEGHSNIVIDGDAGGNADAVLTPTVVDGVITALVIADGGTGYTTGALVITTVSPTNVSVLYPDFDYATFE